MTSGGGESPPKDEAGLKEWIRNKLKALASLLGQLGIKVAEALPGIIGGIVSWILNRVKDVVGWVLQNLWALVVGIGGLIYAYMVTRRWLKDRRLGAEMPPFLVLFWKEVHYIFTTI